MLWSRGKTRRCIWKDCAWFIVILLVALLMPIWVGLSAPSYDSQNGLNRSVILSAGTGRLLQSSIFASLPPRPGTWRDGGIRLGEDITYSSSYTRGHFPSVQMKNTDTQAPEAHKCDKNSILFELKTVWGHMVRMTCSFTIFQYSKQVDFLRNSRIGLHTQKENYIMYMAGICNHFLFIRRHWFVNQ